MQAVAPGRIRRLEDVAGRTAAHQGEAADLQVLGILEDHRGLSVGAQHLRALAGLVEEPPARHLGQEVWVVVEDVGHDLERVDVEDA